MSFNVLSRGPAPHRSSTTSRTQQQHHPTFCAVSPHTAHRRTVSCAAASNEPFSQLSLAEPLAYSKAFADVALRHLTDAAMDAAAEFSMQLAEQPKRMREFAEEVQAAAQKELQGNQQQRLLAATSSAGSSGQQGRGGNSSSLSGLANQADLAALVDDLRADIAASRALLQQIRTSGTGSTGSTGSSSSSSNGAQTPASRR